MSFKALCKAPLTMPKVGSFNPKSVVSVTRGIANELKGLACCLPQK